MNCQKCRVPLKLDQSLQDLNPAAFDLLLGSDLPTVEEKPDPSKLPYSAERRERYNTVARNAAPPILKKSMPPPRRGIAPMLTASPKPGARDNPAMSFVMLTDSQVQASPASTNGKAKNGAKDKSHLRSLPNPDNERQAMSSRMESATRLFEILSSRSDIDHPICSECTELLLSSLQTRLSASVKERDAYIGFLRDLKNNIPTAAEVDAADKELAQAKSAEEKAYEELLSLEEEKTKLEDELAELDGESRALDREEDSFWRTRNAFDLKLSSFRDLRDAMNASYNHDVQQLERLQRTNVYNDTFCIGHDGHFGTINGLRLGRLSPPNNVEWAEINAAWGITALLLATVAEKLGFSFRGYVIKPMGSTSHIERLEYAQSTSGSGSSTAASSAVLSGQQNQLPPGSSSRAAAQQTRPKLISLELFSSGDLPLGRQILHRRFNEAMVAFLECLRQLGEHVRSSSEAGGGDGGLRLPYKIERDKIHGISIKLGVSQDEAWTSACKYTLTCCKFLLAHASNSNASRRVA